MFWLKLRYQWHFLRMQFGIWRYKRQHAQMCEELEQLRKMPSGLPHNVVREACLLRMQDLLDNLQLLIVTEERDADLIRDLLSTI